MENDEKIELALEYIQKMNFEIMKSMSSLATITCLEMLKASFTTIAEKIASRKLSVEQGFMAMSYACDIASKREKEELEEYAKKSDEYREKIVALIPNWNGFAKA